MRSRRVLTAVAVVALVVAALAAGIESANFESHLTATVTVPTTITVTLTSYPRSNGSSVVTEEFIIEPEVLNGICVDQITTATSTAYLVAATPSASRAQNQTITQSTTTETVSAMSTTTEYENVTLISGTSTCTEINPHYNVTQSPVCGPCA